MKSLSLIRSHHWTIGSRMAPLRSSLRRVPPSSSSSVMVPLFTSMTMRQHHQPLPNYLVARTFLTHDNFRIACGQRQQQQRYFSSTYGDDDDDDDENGSDDRTAGQQPTQAQKNLYHWSDEWKALGLGAQLVNQPAFPANLFFVQLGFGVDQHGGNDATKAAIRAVRNAIEFNSIPGVISHLPGGRAEMLIHVKLGVPRRGAFETETDTATETLSLLPVDTLQVAKVFPYGKLLPVEIIPGGLDFHTGRVVEELGDENDVGICVAACVSLGYGEPDGADDKNIAQSSTLHTTYNTKDGY